MTENTENNEKPKLSEQEAEEQALFIKIIRDNLHKLNLDYLKEFVSHHLEKINFQESALVLASNPHVLMSKLEHAKSGLDFIKAIIDLGEKEQEVQKKHSDIAKTINAQREIDRLFDF